MGIMLDFHIKYQEPYGYDNHLDLDLNDTSFKITNDPVPVEWGSIVKSTQRVAYVVWFLIDDQKMY